MEQKFKVGDVVILKSGGPSMTITNDKTRVDLEKGKVWSGSYDCKWFENKTIHKSRFPQDTIELNKE